MNTQYTLTVDEANNGTLVDNTINLHRFTDTRRVYRGEEHSDSSEELVTFTVSDPTPSGESLGRGKTQVKLTKDISVPNRSGSGEVSDPIIATAQFSVPVGATEAEIDYALQYMIALLDNQNIVRDLLRSRDM